MARRANVKNRALRILAPSEGEHAALLAGEHADPHRVLGPQGLADGAYVVRAFHPEANQAFFVAPGDAPARMEELGRGLFAIRLSAAPSPRYRIRFGFPGGGTWEREDPYAHPPSVGELDLHLFAEGTHRRLWQRMGACPGSSQGVPGTAFAVWAPNARRVSLVGDFCGWDGRLLPMRTLGASGVFELFVPELAPGALYKYEILTREGTLRLKADPFGRAMELPPGSASVVASSSFVWNDAPWMERRLAEDPTRRPVSIYEVHLGSWARVVEEGNRFLRYREIAEPLVRHVRELGFTHIELLPIAEHAFYGSWGYQVTGYYAPTARYGSPDDLRFLIDHCHRNQIGVILDWVPAHFPKDDFALRRFDGTALYEHEDPRRGEHPHWGTLIFNYGRREVRNFLMANALYWLHEFHFDALRVDAVASMLYLDYGRAEGEWIPNRFGGRENLDAVEFLQETHRALREDAPGAFTVAEESTAWDGVTRPAEEKGLGFAFKWNMGWMHDTLAYFQEDPLYRGYHHGKLTFGMLYEYSERFIDPLSHDEVVHGKRSLLGKMPGDPWQKFANLRVLLAYQFTRPGKQLLFMGTELAPDREWDHDRSLDWHLEGDPLRQGLARFLADLGSLYRTSPSLWERDPDPEGFAWIDCNDAEQSVLSYERRSGDEVLVVVLNLTPIPRDDYRIGAPRAARYVERLCSDAGEYGGSEHPRAREIDSEDVPWHGRAQSLRLCLPPLSALILAPQS